MRKEVTKIIYYVILLGMILCLSACTENADAEEAGTENIESTEQVQEKQLYEYTEEDFLALSESYKEKGELCVHFSL